MTHYPELIDALLKGTAFDHPVNNLQCIETHISWVILTGDLCYKIKKPVDFGFLNFSTLDLRHHFCKEELRLNARFAPDIYLSVITITGTPSRPEINGHGPILEYAVKMRQFDPAQSFTRLLQDQTLNVKHIIACGQQIAIFHQHIPALPVQSGAGNFEHIAEPVRDNFRQIRELDILSTTQSLDVIETHSLTLLQQLHDIFTQRQHDGFIRECHGDLHCANLAVIEGQVVPFDGIEFNPDFYQIDTINDIAFLVMDLMVHEHDDLACVFLNTYLEKSGDYAGLKVLNFYLIYRTLVKAKVAALRALQCDATERENMMIEFNDYLSLAQRYTRPPRPWLILLHGVSGCGKSWITDRITEQFFAIRIRSDAERKRLWAQQPEPQNPERLYGPAFNKKTYRHLLNLAENILEAGFCLIVDATFLRQSHRQPFLDLAHRKHRPARIISLACDKKRLQQQHHIRAQDPDNLSDADYSITLQQLQVIEPLSQQEQKIGLRLSTQDDLRPLWNMIASLNAD
jgi:aminoglycoside phosphotransferase family enzyme/predicted kinase